MLTKNIVIISLLLFLIPVKSASAQATSYGIANSLVIKEKVQDGDIISFSQKGYAPSKVAYDPTMVGVMSLNPAMGIYIEGEGITKTYPVVSMGNAYVRVSAE